MAPSRTPSTRLNKLLRLFPSLPLLAILAANPATCQTPTTTPSRPLPGLSFAPCNITGPSCVAPRICSDVASLSINVAPSPCTANSTLCACTQPNLAPCVDSTSCPPGERCTRIAPPLDAPLCAACTLDLPPVDSVCAAPLPFLPGFASDPCDTDRPCQDSYSCVTQPTSLSTPAACTPQSTNCGCRSEDGPKRCFGSAECNEGERCANGFDGVRRCTGCFLVQERRLQTIDSGRCISIASPSATPTAPTGPPPRYLGGNFLDPCAPRGAKVNATSVVVQCRAGLTCVRVAAGTVAVCIGDANDPANASCTCSGRLQECVRSATCPDGERCFRTGGTAVSTCGGCLFASIQSNVQLVDGDENCVVASNPSPSPGEPVPSTGPTMPPSPSRQPPASVRPSPSTEISPESSVGDDGIGNGGDNNSDGGNGGGNGGQVRPSASASASVGRVPKASVSPSGPPALSATPEPPICIGAHHLEGEGGGLVFRRHRSAMVLCDGFGSCATGGHMVLLHGKAMRMERYCNEVAGGCVRQRMLVNSPRWRRRARVGSLTPGLEFSALAARWGSAAEEHLLAALILLGA